MFVISLFWFSIVTVYEESREKISWDKAGLFLNNIWCQLWSIKRGREMKIYCNKSVTTSWSENYKIELHGGLVATQIQLQQMWSKLPPASSAVASSRVKCSFACGASSFSVLCFSTWLARIIITACVRVLFSHIHSSLPALSYCLSPLVSLDFRRE